MDLGANCGVLCVPAFMQNAVRSTEVGQLTCNIHQNFVELLMTEEGGPQLFNLFNECLKDDIIDRCFLAIFFIMTFLFCG